MLVGYCSGEGEASPIKMVLIYWIQIYMVWINYKCIVCDILVDSFGYQAL